MVKETELQSLDFEKGIDYDRNCPFSNVYDIKIVTWKKTKNDLQISVSNTYLADKEGNWKFEEQNVELSIMAEYHSLKHIINAGKLIILLFALEIN